MAAQVGGSSLVPITSTTAEAHVAAAVEAAQQEQLRRICVVEDDE